MLLLKLILMLTLVTADEPGGGGAVVEVTTESPTVKEPLCETKMKCLVPEKCTDPAEAASEKLISLTKKMTIDRTCTALLKFRVYTKKKWLIVLKSFDKNAQKVTLKKGSTKYVCEKKCDVEVTSDNMDIRKIDLISTSKSPLMCEFLVKTEDAEVVFDELSPNDVKLSTDSNKEFYITNGAFTDPRKPTCDPLNAVTPVEGSVEDKMIVKIEEAPDTQDVICKAPYSLKFRKDSTEEFKAPSSIACDLSKITRDSGYYVDKNLPSEQFFDATFEAQCEVPTCTMCSTDPPKLPWESESHFNIIVRDDGCQELKCKNGGRMVLLGTLPIEYVSKNVLCRYHDEHGLVFMNPQGVPILNHTRFECQTDRKCEEEEARRICPGCVVNKDNLPQCSDTTRLISTDGKLANVSCNRKEGGLAVTELLSGKPIDGFHSKYFLTCEPIKKEACPPCPGLTEEQKGELTRSHTLAIVFLTIALIIAVLVIVYMCVQKRRAEAAKKQWMGPSAKAVPIKMPARSGRRKGRNTPSNSSNSGSIEPAANSKSTTTPDRTLETPKKEVDPEKEKEKEKENEKLKEREKEREKKRAEEREMMAKLSPQERMKLNVVRDNEYTPDISNQRVHRDL